MNDQPTLNLDAILQPIGLERFMAEYWETKPCLIEREDRSFYGDLFDTRQLDQIITTQHLYHPTINLVQGRTRIPSDDYTYESSLIDVARLYQRYHEGASIVLTNLEVRHPGVAALCRSFEETLSSRFQANVYFTPPGAKGLRPHWDSHDVLVLQLEGEKRWTVFNTPEDLPYRGQDFHPEFYPPGDVTMEFVMRPGDCFYLPRGVMHEAQSLEQDSLHLTVGVLSRTWTDILLEAVAKVGLQDRELRRGLPVGFAKAGYDRTEARAFFADLLRRVSEQADLDWAMDHFVDELLNSRHSILPGQLEQIRKLADLTVDSRMRVRPSVLWQVRRDEETVRLSVYGGETSLPLFAAEPLEAALSSGRFRVGDLPGELDDDGKIALVHTLVREGLVRFDT